MELELAGLCGMCLPDAGSFEGLLMPRGQGTSSPTVDRRLSLQMFDLPQGRAQALWDESGRKMCQVERCFSWPEDELKLMMSTSSSGVVVGK